MSATAQGIQESGSVSPTLYSLVIATYRRPEMLRDTLVSLDALVVPEGVGVEVVVIDNDPEGSGRATVEEQSARPYRFPLRYVHEVRKGLSHARNRGIEESRGDFIAFFDDDLYVSAGWLAGMVGTFARTGAAVVGGRTVIHWEGEPEPSLQACRQHIGALDMGPHDRELRGRVLPGGGNAVFRRSVFASGLRFSTALGRIGKVLLSGEDSELFEQIRREGLSLWYCAEGLVLHRTGGERLTAAYMVRMHYWFGISQALVDLRLHGKAQQWFYALARSGKALLVDAPRWLLGWLRRDPGRRLLACASLHKQYGYVRGALCGRPVVPVESQ
jgi:glycosyltransferase involved in cell wall biosynthesis